MKERPILFSAPMVRAILEGRKTQTRRAVKPQPETTYPNAPEPFKFVEISGDKGIWGAKGCGVSVRKCPYGVVGDRLWVKETWCLSPREDWEQWPAIGKSPRRFWPGTMNRPHIQSQWNSVHNAIYKADGDYQSSDGRRCWASPIHMPRWASRITLELTGVRVERLQEISEADCIAEGIEHTGDRIQDGKKCSGAVSVHGCYRDLWESINGPGSWDANPWVWVLEFKRA